MEGLLHEIGLMYITNKLHHKVLCTDFIHSLQNFRNSLICYAHSFVSKVLQLVNKICTAYFLWSNLFMLLPWMLSTCLLLSLVSKESGAILTWAWVSSNGFTKRFNRELKQPRGLWQIKHHLKISICAVVAVSRLLHFARILYCCSRCCLVVDINELYSSACHMRSTIIFLHSTNHIIVFWRRLCGGHCLCLSSLINTWFN